MYASNVTMKARPADEARFAKRPTERLKTIPGLTSDRQGRIVGITWVEWMTARDTRQSNPA
jgi:hypothetical protein